jgi:hypothetical protein
VDSNPPASPVWVKGKYWTICVYYRNENNLRLCFNP